MILYRILNLQISVGFFLFLLCSPITASSLYPFSQPKQEAQFKYLLKELRCLVCQNQDLADSNADLARDLRDEVYGLVKDGQSDHEIIDYLTKRYGDFILFKPPVKSVTALLWFGPALFLILGLLVFWRSIRQGHHDPNGGGS
ncbi:MAG: cytochrome C biogenesis protein [Legionellales bacterium RIFCSPHIGHO2_12_FULL_42_9]|nr:MAG: cytochrome C biogenesis protein [Legionellales bacterium RIFCSPHIGHO2_12_FULL_42_9]